MHSWQDDKRTRVLSRSSIMLSPPQSRVRREQEVGRWTDAWLLAMFFWLLPSTVQAARFVAFFPSATASTAPASSANLSQVKMLVPAAAPEKAAEVFDDATLKAWQQYCETWQQFHQSADDVTLRKRLAIATNPFAYAVNPSSTALTSRMPLSGMKRYDSAHFQLFTDVSQERLKKVIVELEQFYAVWTQMFFPLWNQAPGWIENSQAPRLKAVPKHRWCCSLIQRGIKRL